MGGCSGYGWTFVGRWWVIALCITCLVYNYCCYYYFTFLFCPIKPMSFTFYLFFFFWFSPQSHREGMRERLCGAELLLGWTTPAGKQGNLLGWDEDSLTGETKLCAQGKQHGELILFPTVRQMSAVFWIGGPQQAWWLFGKTSATSMYFLLFLLSLRWAHHMVWAIPLVTSGHLSWLFPFSASCSTPAYWLEVSMGNGGNRVALEAMQVLFI